MSSKIRKKLKRKMGVIQLKKVSIKVGQHFPEVIQNAIWSFIERTECEYKLQPEELQYIELLSVGGRLEIKFWQVGFLITGYLGFNSILPTLTPFGARLFVVNKESAKRMMYENEYWYFERFGGSSPSGDAE